MRELTITTLSDEFGQYTLFLECPCGHTELLTTAMLATAGVAPDRKVLDLSRRMRCRECDALGRAVVSIKWAASQFTNS